MALFKSNSFKKLSDEQIRAKTLIIKTKRQEIEELVEEQESEDSEQEESEQE